MASSIKLKDSTKEQLEKLQARLLLEFNKKLNQQEILDILVSIGKENPEILLVPNIPVESKMFREMEKLISSGQLETDPEIIDNMLYGDH